MDGQVKKPMGTRVNISSSYCKITHTHTHTHSLPPPPPMLLYVRVWQKKLQQILPEGPDKRSTSYCTAGNNLLFSLTGPAGVKPSPGRTRCSCLRGKKRKKVEDNDCEARFLSFFLFLLSPFPRRPAELSQLRRCD